MNRLILSLIALVALTSCFEETAFDTSYVLSIYEQRESSGDYLPLVGTKAYAFKGTTEELYFESYDDAEVGIATSIITGEEQGAFTQGESFEGSENRLNLQLDHEEVVVLLIDPSSQTYAYTDYTVPMNFSSVLVDMVFRQWKDGTYTAGKWTFVAPKAEEEDEVPTTEE